MHLSLYTDYSLRVLLYLGANHGSRLTMAEMASVFGISHDHLRKVVHALGKQGYITTYRGKSGGFELARDPADINIGELVEVTEPRRPVIDCDPCILVSACALQGILGKAENAFYDLLKEYTLADLLKGKQLKKILVSQA